MSGINLGRVIIGGIAAGLVIDVGEALFHLALFAEQAQAFAESIGASPEPSGSEIAIYNVLGIGIGITIAWLYAAIRPRMGPGPMAGLCAGLFAWALFSLFNVLFWIVGGIVSTSFGLTVVVWQAFELGAAGIVAGALYKEN